MKKKNEKGLARYGRQIYRTYTETLPLTRKKSWIAKAQREEHKAPRTGWENEIDREDCEWLDDYHQELACEWATERLDNRD